MDSASSKEKYGVQLAKLLRDRYPKNTAKLVARDFGMSPETAKEWIAFDGRMPNPEVLFSMLELYGPKFASQIDPDAEWCLRLQLEVEIQELAGGLQRIQNIIEALSEFENK